MKALTKVWQRGRPAESDLQHPSSHEKDLRPFKTYSDAVFGQVALMQSGATREYVLVRERTFEGSEAARAFLLLTAGARELEHPYLLRMLDYSAAVERSLCSKRYSVRQLYAFPRSDLRREIDRRAQDAQPFGVAEMVHLLYQLVEVNAYLQARGVCHGALSPAAVGLQLEGELRAQLKLLSDERPSRNAQREARLRDFLAKRPLYVSPGYFRCVIRGVEFAGDEGAEDVFAAGLVLLEAGALKPPAQVYRADGELDQQALQRLLQEFKARYAADSTLLVSVLENMLQQDDSRPGFQDLKDNMPPYEEIRAYLRENAQGAMSASRSFEQRERPKTLVTFE